MSGVVFGLSPDTATSAKGRASALSIFYQLVL
jgi:hypothetical protein